MEICIITFVFEKLVLVELEEGNVAANRSQSPCCGTTTPERICKHTGEYIFWKFRQADGPTDVDRRAVEYEGAEGCNQKAKDKQTGDDSRLVVEFLEYAPQGYLETLLQVFRHALSSGQIPTSWQTTISKMLPKSVSNFRPIANLGLLYNFFRLSDGG